MTTVEIDDALRPPQTYQQFPFWTNRASGIYLIETEWL
jgi:hypothetical protein